MNKLFIIVVITTIAITAYIVYVSIRDSDSVLENGASHTASVVYSRPDPSIPVVVSTLPVIPPKLELQLKI